MEHQEFSQKIKAMSQRMVALAMQASAEGEPTVYPQTVEELQTALEELHVAEEELRHQNEELLATRHAVEVERLRYQELFELAPDAYLLTDTRGTILEANRAAGALLNVPPESLVRKLLVRFLELEHRRGYREWLSRLPEADGIHAWELRLRPYHREPLDIAVTVAIIRNAKDEPRDLHWLLRDISPRKRAEEQLQTLHAELEERVRERTRQLEDANRQKEELLVREREARARAEAAAGEIARLYQELKKADRSKDEFLAMLAHELRNPLAPLRNAVSVRRLGGHHPELVEKAWTMVERQVEHLSRLVDDLLDVSRITQGKIELRKQSVRLAEVVDRAVEDIGPFIEESGHTLMVALPPDPMDLEADPVRLCQILVNLLHNAAKYTERGGRIELSAERAGGDVLIRVRDTGVGIAPELLPRVFDLFSQAERSLDRSQGGLGIGLTLVRRLVEMHGGRVSAVSSGPGQGSEFTVRLPTLSPAPAAHKPAAPPSSEPAPDAVARRVLLVDDNEDGAESLAMLLKAWGHEVTVAYTGAAALEAAQAQRPEVILLDIGLPGIDGYEVARRLRQQAGLEQTRLIAVTGYGQENDRLRSRAAGFDYHLVKPLDLSVLRELLGQG
jgi:PAS domain S-box-containing protein